MAVNYELITNYNVPSPTSTLTFNSLGAYDDLEVYIVGSCTSGTTVSCYINGDQGAFYNNVGNSATASQGASSFSTENGTAGTVIGYRVGTGTNLWRARLYFPQYRNTDYVRTWQMSSINKAGNQEGIDCITQYSSSNAMTSLSFNCGTTFTTSTWVQIYGIKAA